MVVAAVTGLKERKGSSLAAIKKYVGAHYRCDAEKLAPFIRRFVKKAVRDGTLVQKSGTGASGSFRLGKVKKSPKKKAKKSPKKKARKSPKKKAKKSPKKKAKTAKKATKSPKKAKKASKKAKKPVKKAKAKKSPAKKAKK